VGAHVDRVSGSDGVRQRVGGVECLSREDTTVGDQLLHRVAGRRRHHGRSVRHATCRLRRGRSPPTSRNIIDVNKISLCIKT